MFDIFLSIRQHRATCRHPLDMFSVLYPAIWIWFGRARYFLVRYLYTSLLFFNGIFRVQKETSGRGKKRVERKKYNSTALAKRRAATKPRCWMKQGVWPICNVCSLVQTKSHKKSTSRSFTPFCEICSVFLHTRYMSPCKPLNDVFLLVSARHLFGRLFLLDIWTLRYP